MKKPTQGQQPDIQIEITPQYLKEKSNPNEKRYFFTYTLKFQNKSNHSVQFLGRQWKITEENGQTKTIENDSITEDFPIIQAHTSYQHQSAAILSTTSGTLEGSCAFSTNNGEPFEIKVPKSFLIVARSIH